MGGALQTLLDGVYEIEVVVVVKDHVVNVVELQEALLEVPEEGQVLG